MALFVFQYVQGWVTGSPEWNAVVDNVTPVLFKLKIRLQRFWP